MSLLKKAALSVSCAGLGLVMMGAAVTVYGIAISSGAGVAPTIVDVAAVLLFWICANRLMNLIWRIIKYHG